MLIGPLTGLATAQIGGLAARRATPGIILQGESRDARQMLPLAFMLSQKEDIILDIDVDFGASIARPEIARTSANEFGDGTPAPENIHAKPAHLRLSNQAASLRLLSIAASTETNRSTGHHRLFERAAK